MMPELGDYAAAVLGAYAVTLAILAVLVGSILLRARRVRQALEQMEARRGRNG